MKLYTKEELIQKFIELSELGWIKNGRCGNCGGIGNTLEDYLGIEENNLPIPNSAEWELKTQRIATTALTTLFHAEPSPRAVKFVPRILLPMYGWEHKEAGKKYNQNEMSFHQTIHAKGYSDRGFGVKIDRDEERIQISFDSSKVNSRHADWLKNVEENIGLEELSPQPYWGFHDLEHKLGVKLLNCFYAQAIVKSINGEEYYWYKKVQKLHNFCFDNFLNALENGFILVDFDARTGHNHGTKFRLRQNHFCDLYGDVEIVVDITEKN